MEGSLITKASRQLQMVSIPNPWNDFQNTSPEKELKVNMTCCIKTFGKIVNDYKLASSKTLQDSPFRFLLSLINYEVNENFVKKIADSYDLDDNSFTLCGTKYTPHVNDFNDILRVTNGNAELIDTKQKPSDYLINKFCLEDDKKFVSMHMVKKTLNDQENDEDVKRTFSLAVLRYIVCSPSSGKLDAWMLNYVEDVSGITTKPWGTLAMQCLLKGVKTYQKRTGKLQCSLGGSMVFLQLYYLSKTKNMRPAISISFGKKETTNLFNFDEVKKMTPNGPEGDGKEMEISRTNEKEDNSVTATNSNIETSSKTSEEGYDTVNSNTKISNIGGFMIRDSRSRDAFEIKGKNQVPETCDDLIAQFRALGVTSDNKVEIKRKKLEFEEKKGRKEV